jgi:hypothetical protein
VLLTVGFLVTLVGVVGLEVALLRVGTEVALLRVGAVGLPLVVGLDVGAAVLLFGLLRVSVTKESNGPSGKPDAVVEFVLSKALDDSTAVLLLRKAASAPRATLPRRNKRAAANVGFLLLVEP